MKSLNTIQKLSKLGSVLSKIAFVLALVGCGGIVCLLSFGFGSGHAIKLGSVTLHGLIGDRYGMESLAAVLPGWLIVCAGEAVVAKFAELYFKHERNAGTPFTLAGAKELLRIGILTIAVPGGCAIVGSIVEELTAGFMGISTPAAMDLYFDNAASIALGVMFILGALLCRYGAELASEKEA